MNKVQKINHYEILDSAKKIDSPFSREVFISNIKKDYGKGIMIKYDIGNGIAIFASSFTTVEDFILIQESSIPGGVLIFNLEGELLFKYKDGKEHILEEKNFLMALASHEFYSELYLKANKHYTTVSIGIKEELFLNLTKSLENIDEYLEKAKKNSYALFKNAKIDPRQFEIVSYFKEHNSYEDLLNNFILESKIIDLSHYTIQKMLETLGKKEHKVLDKTRVKSLKKAKEVILQEYSNNISIKEIAYKSATNECYLKRDFKIYYGMTVYEMLQNHRMERSKYLLQENMGVKEVANKVGYKHAGNFSKTFYKYYGITPGNYKKSIKSLHS